MAIDHSLKQDTTMNMLSRAASPTCLLLSVLAVSSPAVAQEEPAGINVNVTAEVTLDVVSQYFFRGIEQQDSGLIFQPGASFTFDVLDGAEGETVSNVDFYVGLWESFHSTPTVGAPTSPKSWYEQDVFAGLSVDFAEILNLDLGYVGYFSPSDSFSEIHEIGIKLSAEDEGWMGEAWSFDPYILVAFEVQDNGGTEDTYLEIGGELSFDMTDEYGIPLTWTVPVACGMSLDDYYTDATGDNEFFGFASVGLTASMPLSYLLGSEEYAGAWSISAGVTLLFLNDDAALTDDASGGSDSFQVVGALGLSREW